MACPNRRETEPDSHLPAEIDELPMKGELPRALATRLARAKAEAALQAVRLDEELRGSVIVAADTIVAGGGPIHPQGGEPHPGAARPRPVSAPHPSGHHPPSPHHPPNQLPPR